MVGKPLCCRSSERISALLCADEWFTLDFPGSNLTAEMLVAPGEISDKLVAPRYTSATLLRFPSDQKHCRVCFESSTSQLHSLPPFCLITPRPPRAEPPLHRALSVACTRLAFRWRHRFSTPLFSDKSHLLCASCSAQQPHQRAE